MRVFNDTFNSFNALAKREPVFVVELSFDQANTDIHYLTSEVVPGLTGNIINNTIKRISSTSQRVSPEKALSTIGSIKFECLDSGLTDLQRSKLDAGSGLKGKRVQVYKGFRSQDWSTFALIQTQVISSDITFKDGVYTFQCADIQRELRKDIFDVKETALQSSISATATTIPVFDTSQFEMVKQPSSPSGLTDAPGQTVGYLKIENDDQVEIIRYTGKTGGSFTGCTRGVLGTRPIAVEVNTSDADKSTKVEEYIYLEMAAPKLIYALLTGVIYGQPEGLPDHWHLGLSANYVKTSDFEEIGTDWWDLSDNDAGVPAVIRGVTKTNGKRFIEQELLIMLGAFMPVYANGEIGLKRLSPIIGDGGYDRILDETNVVDYSDLKHDLASVINQIVISWNYVENREGFTRRSVLIDPDSIAKNGKADPLELKLRALESSRHSYSTIKNRFDALRERYAGAPLRLSLTLLPTENDLEVGDIVRVNLPQLKDFTKDGDELDRNFEVQRVQQDWISGRVKVELFGSSAIATAVPEENPETVIEPSFYNSLGTEISAANFGGAVSSSGGITTVSGDITLTGGSNINSASSIFYCNEDLTFNAGATITINNNVQLRVKGFFQQNGIIDGKGRGFVGGVGIATSGAFFNTPSFGYNISKPYRGSANNGTRGFIDPRQIPQRGAAIRSTSSIQVYPEIEGNYVEGGTRNGAPVLDVKFNGTDQLTGIPSDLRGSSGTGGNSCRMWNTTSGSQTIVVGSNGGASGAGLVIVCQGADIGANGVIDTSGQDAGDPQFVDFSAQPWATGGADNWGSAYGCSGMGGACGAVYWFIDGVTSNPPNLNASNSLAFIGKSKDYVYPGSWDRVVSIPASIYSPPVLWNEIQQSNPNKTASSYFYSNRLNRINAYQAAHKVQFVTGLVEPDNDVTTYAEDATFSLTEFSNTPRTSAGDRSTIEVSITPPVGDDTYSFSRIEYRKQGTTAWESASPSNFESTFEVKSDGSTYEVRSRSVSTDGVESPSGPIQTIVTTDVVGRPNAELATIYPLETITGLQLDEVNDPVNVFTGLGPNFEWDDANNQLVYFSHYEVKIYDDSNNLLRTEKSVSPFYSYSVEKNRADYKEQTTNDGFYSTIEIRVTPVSRYKNDLNQLYGGTPTAFTVYASTVNDPNNLLFYVIPSKTSDLTDDANLGGTANWDDVSGSNKPENNATAGATWEGNITGQPNRQNVLNNLVDISDWELGGPLPSVLSTSGYGWASANSLVVSEGPFDFDEVVWQVKAASLAQDDGGFSFRTSVLINPNKVHRVSFWFYASSTNGTLRFSPSNSSVVRTLDTDAVQIAPYQHVAGAPQAGKWYLVVMVIHPAGTLRIGTSGLSGIYDPDTGDIVSFFDEFKFTTSATSLRTNIQYIDIGNTTDYVYFARPRLEVIDGSESRLSALLGTPPDFYLEVNKSLGMVNVRSDGVKLSGTANVSTSRVSTGRYRITHNSGYSGKGVIVSARSSSIQSTAILSETSSKFDVFLYNSAGAVTDSDFTLILDPDYRG